MEVAWAWSFLTLVYRALLVTLHSFDHHVHRVDALGVVAKLRPSRNDLVPYITLEYVLLLYFTIISHTCTQVPPLILATPPEGKVSPFIGRKLVLVLSMDCARARNSNRMLTGSIDAESSLENFPYSAENVFVCVAKWE